MPFAPHTHKEIVHMLKALGASSIEELFDEVPDSLLVSHDLDVMPALNELELMRLMEARQAQDATDLSFLGAGAYEHHIPAAVWEIAARGEYMTAYTPYQAEASQGTLQVIYEYQSMICRLTGMEVANASLYDGATALAEAILMAVRANKHSKTKRVLMPESLHPFYRAVCRTLTEHQQIELVPIAYHAKEGGVDFESLVTWEQEDCTALVIGQPNFFGCLEEVDALTQWAHQKNCFVIAVVNPISLGLLKAPGQWGDTGAEIVVGEGQPLGLPLSSGGPYFGFMCAKKSIVRQMPGRIIGRTEDHKGRTGFVLTLQAREQHIRRSKATSNICTNQGLAVTVATIYMSLMGGYGLQQVALKCHENLQKLQAALLQLPGIQACFSRSCFHEWTVRLSVPVEAVLVELAKQGMLAGVHLGSFYSELEQTLLLCATETKTAEDIERFTQALGQAMNTVAHNHTHMLS